MAKPGLDSGAKSGLSELKARLLFVLGAIVVFRLGSYAVSYTHLTLPTNREV